MGGWMGLEVKAVLRIAYINQKKSSPGWVSGWVDGWMGGWMGLKAIIRIAYSNQQDQFQTSLMIFVRNGLKPGYCIYG